MTIAAASDVPAPQPEGAPVGPGSLTWRYFGDLRNVLVGPRAGVLQSMHPAISAALLEHSDFFDNPYNRLLRSAGPILGVVYDQRPEATGAEVRDYHQNIRGTDSQGRRYHALDAGAYYWAHATFFEGQIAAQELFGEPLSASAKEQLYQESVTWYARYGMKLSHLPKDYPAFERYFQDTLDHVLEATRVAKISVVRPRRVMPAPYPWLRGPVWQRVAPPLVDGSLFLTRATLPARARELLELPFTEEDARRLARFAGAVRHTWKLLPERARYMPRAYRALRRARA